MRARTGNAVSASEAPRNSANGQNGTAVPATMSCSACRCTASASPSANGSSDRTRSIPRRPRRLAPADEPQVEVPADGEHEQHEPELADQLAAPPSASAGKRCARRVAGQRAQQRRSERDARHDLADHRRLAHALEQQAARPRRDEDHRDVQQDPAGRRGRRSSGDAIRAAAAAARARGPASSWSTRSARRNVASAWSRLSPTAVSPTLPSSASRAHHVEDDAGLARLVEVQAVADRDVEQVVDRQAAQEVGSSRWSVATRCFSRPLGAVNSAVPGSYVPSVRNWSVRNGWVVPPLRRLSSIAYGVHASWRVADDDEVHGEAAEHALARQGGRRSWPPRCVIAARSRSRRGSGTRGSVWPLGPPRSWSCVESSSTSPSGVTRSCTLGLRSSAPPTRSSTIPPSCASCAR